MRREQPAQKPDDDQSAVFVFKTQVREVILHATVVDEQRHLVTNLDRPAFTAFENGVPQATTSFHRDDVPVAMGIVIDNSGSMREKRDKVNQAVLNLIRASGPNDETFVVNFSQNSYLDQDYTSDVEPAPASSAESLGAGQHGALRRHRRFRGAFEEQCPRGAKGSAGHHRRPGQCQSGNATGGDAPLAAGEWANALRHRLARGRTAEGGHGSPAESGRGYRRSCLFPKAPGSSRTTSRGSWRATFTASTRSVTSLRTIVRMADTALSR